MSAIALRPMSSPSRTTPLRHPAHRAPREKSRSPSFPEQWRDRMRSDLVARLKSARENKATEARGGEEEVQPIFLGEVLTGR
jgi:hypothetical protein